MVKSHQVGLENIENDNFGHFKVRTPFKMAENGLKTAKTQVFDGKQILAPKLKLPWVIFFYIFLYRNLRRKTCALQKKSKTNQAHVIQLSMLPFLKKKKKN